MLTNGSTATEGRPALPESAAVAAAARCDTAAGRAEAKEAAVACSAVVGLGESLPDARDVAGEVASRFVPAVRVLLEASLHDPPEGKGKAGRLPLEGIGLLADDRRHRFRPARAQERARSRQHLVQQRAEGELVRAEIERLAERLLGRHVGERADRHARHGHARRRRRRIVRTLGGQPLGQAEVDDLREAVGRDHHVLGLQVAVDDPNGVGLGQPLGDLRRNREHLLRRQRAACERLAKRLPLDELHRDVEAAFGFSNVVHRDDVRVVERRGGSGFPLEARHPVGIRRQAAGKHLDRHLATKPRIDRPVHLAHAAGRKTADDFVPSDFETCREAHRHRPDNVRRRPQAVSLSIALDQG
jgi:hypothetical protein